MSGLLNLRTTSLRPQWDNIFSKNQVVVSLSLEPGSGQDITMEYANEEFLRSFLIVSDDDYVDNVLWQPNSQDLLRGQLLKSLLYEDPTKDDQDTTSDKINLEIRGHAPTHQRILHLTGEAMMTGGKRTCYALMRRKDGDPMFCHMAITPLSKGSTDAVVENLCLKRKKDNKSEYVSGEGETVEGEEEGSSRKKRKACFERARSKLVPKIYSDEELKGVLDVCLSRGDGGEVVSLAKTSGEKVKMEDETEVLLKGKTFSPAVDTDVSTACNSSTILDSSSTCSGTDRVGGKEPVSDHVPPDIPSADPAPAQVAQSKLSPEGVGTVPLKHLSRGSGEDTWSRIMHDKLQIVPTKRERMYAIITIRSTPSVASASHMSGFYYHGPCSYSKDLDAGDDVFQNLFSPSYNGHGSIPPVGRGIAKKRKGPAG